MEEYSEMIWKIWKKIVKWYGKKWKKAKLNSDKKGKIRKKDKLNSEKDLEIMEDYGGGGGGGKGDGGGGKLL